MRARPFGRSLADLIPTVSKRDKTPIPVRPFGRSLADFGTLNSAEQELLKSSRAGELCVIANDRPAGNGKTAANLVRAGFLRFLILGGDDENPVHEHGVRIQGAWVEGELDLEGVATTSDVLLISCWFDQTPVFNDAHIKGNLMLSDTRVPGLKGDRLICDADLRCWNGFLSDGEVRLIRASIGGDLVCDGASFNSQSQYSIIASGMGVAGTFFFRGLKAPKGEVVVAHAHVRVLADDDVAWGQNLNLNGFTYERIEGLSPKDAKTRIEWLDKQRPEWSGKDRKTTQFRAQPWLHLREVLRGAGHREDARKVGIEFERRRRRAGQITGDDPITRFFAKNFHRIYGVFTGYGYRPIRLLYWSLFIWLACAALYDYDAYRNKFTPAAFSIYEDPSCRAVAVAEKGAPPGNPVFEPPCNGNYTTFSPLMYSLNVFLPVVQLGQEAAWAPATKPFSPVLWQNLIRPFTEPASFLQLVIWLETLFGWVAGLLLVAVVSGLARKQDES